MAKPIARDYCKKRQARKAEQWKTAIARDSNDAMTIQDLNGDITAWNRGAEKIYGYSEREALEMNIRQLTSSEKLADLQHFMEDLQHEVVLESFETKRQTKKGEPLDIWLTVTPLKDRSGHLQAIATTERDITARKKRENELVQTVALLQQSLTELKTLPGIVPICSYCKNIRNAKGQYEQLEIYFYNETNVRFSHTVCPSCAEIHFPDYVKKSKKFPRSTS